VRGVVDTVRCQKVLHLSSWSTKTGGIFLHGKSA
jgi:hypothetical protein